MEPGDVFCFHNRKMLHSRLAFEMNGGIRHFQVRLKFHNSINN